MKRILLPIPIFIMILTFAFTTIAEDEYIQYNLDKLTKKSEIRLKDIDKKLDEILGI